MAQLDIITFLGQVTTLLVTFTFTYLIMRNVFIPNVSSLKKFREKVALYYETILEGSLPYFAGIVLSQLYHVIYRVSSWSRQMRPYASHIPYTKRSGIYLKLLS